MVTVHAVYTRDYETLKKLAFNFHRCSVHGLTPMSAACSCNDVEVATFLLDNGYDVNWINSFGRNCLFHANSKEMIRLFVERGVRLDVMDRYGEMAIDSLPYVWRFLEFTRLGQKPAGPFITIEEGETERMETIQSMLPVLMLLCNHYPTDLVFNLKCLFY